MHVAQFNKSEKQLSLICQIDDLNSKRKATFFWFLKTQDFWQRLLGNSQSVYAPFEVSVSAKNLVVCDQQAIRTGNLRTK